MTARKRDWMWSGTTYFESIRLADVELALAKDPLVEAPDPCPEKQCAEGYEHGINDIKLHVRRCSQSSTETFSHVDKRVEADEGLQPGKASNLDRRQGRPRVVGTAEEGYGEDNEPPHDTDVSW